MSLSFSGFRRQFSKVFQLLNTSLLKGIRDKFSITFSRLLPAFYLQTFHSIHLVILKSLHNLMKQSALQNIFLPIPRLFFNTLNSISLIDELVTKFSLDLVETITNNIHSLDDCNFGVRNPIPLIRAEL